MLVKELCLFLLLSNTLFAAQKIAKVTMLRGEVKFKESEGGAIKPLKQDEWVPEGSLIQTAPKSFIKLTFNDQSQINLGPDSKIVVSTFQKDKPGMISVIQGQLRGKVTKDVLKDGQDEKLVVTTRSAAMGIRGTDFQVIYNEENKTTSLVTFEGAVAMAKVDSTKGDILNTGAMSQVLKGEGTVTVGQGQFSGASPNTASATIPTKISPAQFESMKKNETLKEATATATKTYASPIPPGVSSQGFVAATKVDQQVAQASAGPAGANKEATKNDTKNPPAEGMVTSSGAFAPPAGGFVDMKTGLYIAPPPGSTFDANTGVYVPPASVGKFDPATGSYVPPAGFTLNASGEFKVADKSSGNGNKDSGASGDKAKGLAAPPPSMALSANSFVPPNQAVVISDSGGTIKGQDLAGNNNSNLNKSQGDSQKDKLADAISSAKDSRDDKVQQNQQAAQDNSLKPSVTSSNVNFIINVVD